MVMGCVVSVYLDKRPPVVGLRVAAIPLLLDTAGYNTSIHGAKQCHSVLQHRQKVHMQIPSRYTLWPGPHSSQKVYIIDTACTQSSEGIAFLYFCKT